ncbi:SIP2-dominant suppressor of some ts mutations in RPO21 and PRP4 [Apiospora saccharicola]|uniref:SIP2-dominant suppressor of some ts mutations in RPO21 and PRP4 n=1 Tax=Apiospora saccharicola TaxID=335842 RepID=A0ABR1TNF1_9PEZI
MGNTPSTSSKPDTPTHHHHHIPSRDGQPQGHGVASAPLDPPRPRQKEPKHQEPKHLISSYQHQHRSAASSPEASVVQAQGSTIGPPQRRTFQAALYFQSILPSFQPTDFHCSQSPSKQAETEEIPLKHEPSKPVAVPTAIPTHESSSIRSTSLYEDSILTGPGSSSVQEMSYQMNRPPRLPLPIEEEVHTPGSPIIAPTDIGEPIDDSVPELDKDAKEADLQRKSSAVSNATDEEDTEELRVDKTRPTVPTRVEWLQGGQKVYVTGTPFQWSRKQRLFPAKGREGVLEAVIPVFPGTHHIKFLVDGSMETSIHLPTTVDFGNNLVNYIEVSGEAAVTREFDGGASPPRDAEEAAALPSRPGSQDKLTDADNVQHKRTLSIPPPEVFSERLPKYLADFDQPEDSRPYQLSIAALDKLPTPLSLPSFLTKPIMNNHTLIKDDNSVLNMPNHTVLNHLATSSIKNNVLAVSATTRYRSKYVTTIVYKPTSDDS